MTYILERTQIIERPRGDAFAFFSDAFNLELITPRFLNFRVLTSPPVRMAGGTLLAPAQPPAASAAQGRYVNPVDCSG